MTAWAGNNPRAAWPAAVYGCVLLTAAIAYLILERAIVRYGGGGLAQMVGPDVKAILSPLLYLSGIGVSFVRPWIAELLYATVAAMWLVPDRRIERAFTPQGVTPQVESSMRSRAHRAASWTTGAGSPVNRWTTSRAPRSGALPIA